MQGGGDGDLVELAIRTGANAIAPGVGTLLCFVTRKALEKDDEARLVQHLREAMRVGARSGEGLPPWAWIRKGKRRRRLWSARRRAAKDMDIIGTFDAAPVRSRIEVVAGDSESEPGDPATETREFLSIPYLIGFTGSQLENALDSADLNTWTGHMSDGLATHIERALLDEGESAESWACIVTSESEATVEAGRAVDLVSWAETVTLRFEIGLAADPSMEQWVTRLDAHDETLFQREMLDAVRGVRIALLLIALVLLLTLPTLAIADVF